MMRRYFQCKAIFALTLAALFAALPLDRLVPA